MSRRVDGLGAGIIVIALLLSGGAHAQSIDYGVDLPNPKAAIAEPPPAQENDGTDDYVSLDDSILINTATTDFL